MIGIDHIKELVDDSINNVKKDDPSLMSSGRVKLIGKSQKQQSKMGIFLSNLVTCIVELLKCIVQMCQLNIK